MHTHTHKQSLSPSLHVCLSLLITAACCWDITQRRNNHYHMTTTLPFLPFSTANIWVVWWCTPLWRWICSQHTHTYTQTQISTFPPLFLCLSLSPSVSFTLSLSLSVCLLLPSLSPFSVFMSGQQHRPVLAGRDQVHSYMRKPARTHTHTQRQTQTHTHTNTLSLPHTHTHINIHMYIHTFSAAASTCVGAAMKRCRRPLNWTW